jgi:nucleoside-diphosphate-sugar epimerase
MRIGVASSGWRSGARATFFGPGALNSTMGASVFESVSAGGAVRVTGNPDLTHTYSYIDDIGRGLVTLGEDSRSLGQVWHLPNLATLTTLTTSSSRTSRTC